MLRQARLLRSLSSIPGVAVPSVLAEDVGMPPALPPFFVMGFVHGESLVPHVDAKYDADLPAPAEIPSRERGHMNAILSDAKRRTY